MRVRNEGENRLKKTLWNSKNLSLSYKRNFLQLRKISLSHTHTHAPLSFFVDWYSPFFSPETCRALLLPRCVSAVCSPCVCVCPRVGKRCVESNVSRLIHPDVAFCRLSLLVIWAENWSPLGLCLFVEECVCTRVSVCVCFSSLICVYFQSLSQLSQLLSVFLSFLCSRCYLGINNEDSEECVRICVLHIFHHEKKNNIIFSLGCHL